MTAGVGCRTPTEPFLLELGWLSLKCYWQQSALRFWNQLVALPEDYLYRDVVLDSVITRTGLPGACIAFAVKLVMTWYCIRTSRRFKVWIAQRSCS